MIKWQITVRLLRENGTKWHRMKQKRNGENITLIPNKKGGGGVDKERLNDLLQNIFKTEYRKYRRLQEKAVEEQ